jgi:hypothetical protein
MGEVSLAITILVGAISGITSHVGYFIRDEHHMSGPGIIAIAFVSPIILSSLLLRYAVVDSYYEAGLITATAVGSYIASLLSSIVSYRLLFHPLRKFPGPFYLRISKWNHTWLLIFKGVQNYRRVDEWHTKYGDIVRFVEERSFHLDID